MSSDSAVTYTFVHSEARSWSIPSEDPYEEAARQLLEQAPRPSGYVPDPIELKDHVPMYIPKPEHPEDLVPAEDEASIEPYITEVASAPTPPLPPPSLLPTLIRPPHTRATMAQRRATAPSIYHSLRPAGTPPLVKVRESSVAAAARQPGSTMARRVDHSFVDTVDTSVQDTEKRTMVAVEVVNLRVSYQEDVCRRESLGFYSRHQEAQEDWATMRAEIKILRRERLAYEQESIETRQALARSEAYSRALEKMAPKRTTRSTPVTPALTATTTTVTEAQLQAFIDQGVVAAMAEAEASRVRNGYDSNGSRLRPAQAVRKCSYSEFLKCKPLDLTFDTLKAMTGVIRTHLDVLRKWELCLAVAFSQTSCQSIFGTCNLTRRCSLLGGIDHDKDNYYPKLLISSTSVDGVTGFPEEVDKMKSISVVADMILGSIVVYASKRKPCKGLSKLQLS
ncbi:hypothetical protein Tco_0669950 [Tanacetum coccineum]